MQVAGHDILAQRVALAQPAVELLWSKRGPWTPNFSIFFFIFSIF